MIPWEVGSDPRLSANDVRVYFALAGARRGSDSVVGMRRIATICRIGYRKIGKHLKKLVETGHIEVDRGARGQRSQYHLTSPVFAAAVEEAASGGRPQQNLGRPLKCGKCGELRPKLLKIGICRSCNWKQRVRTEAREVAREEIAGNQALRKAVAS